MPAASRTRERRPSAPTTRRAEIELPSAQRSTPAVRAERQRLERAGGVHRDTARAHERDERGAQRALLDDPGERALAQLVGGEVEERARIALDAHRLHGGDAIGRNVLPCALRAQERGAAGADRVDARVPALRGRGRFRRRHAGAIGERDGEAGRDERRREREPDQAGAGDEHVVVGGRRGHWRGPVDCRAPRPRGLGAPPRYAALMAPGPGSRSRGAGSCRCKGRPRWSDSV